MMNLKRTLLALLAVLLVSGIQAQVTVTDADMPSPGDLLRYSISDSFPDLADVSATVGGGLSWDYSWFNPVAQRTDSFVAIGDVPITIRFFFPFSANLALYIETPDSIGGFGLGAGYQIYQVSGGAYQNLGFGGTLSGIPISLVNNPTDTVLSLPLQVGDADSSVSTATLAVPNLIYYSQSRKRVWEADADGQLTTPFGTFTTVRVHSTVTGQDSIAFDTLAFSFNPPVQETFDWYSPDHPGSLLSVGVSGQDSTIQFVSNLSYADSLRDVLQIQLGLTNPQTRPLGMYPNPAQQDLYVEIPDQRGTLSMSIFALNGQEVWSGPLMVGQDHVKLPVLPKGIYQVVVKSEEEIYQGKLLIE